jgi:hypothetical protein
MSHFQTDASVESNLIPSDLVKALIKGANLVGAEVRQHSESELELFQGDEDALRFRGGILSPLHYFPVVALVSVFPSPGGSQVQIRISDTWSGGVLFGMKKKYVQALDQFKSLIIDMCA